MKVFPQKTDSFCLQAQPSLQCIPAPLQQPQRLSELGPAAASHSALASSMPQAGWVFITGNDLDPCHTPLWVLKWVILIVKRGSRALKIPLGACVPLGSVSLNKTCAPLSSSGWSCYITCTALLQPLAKTCRTLFFFYFFFFLDKFGMCHPSLLQRMGLGGPTLSAAQPWVWAGREGELGAAIRSWRPWGAAVGCPPSGEI